MRRAPRSRRAGPAPLELWAGLRHLPSSQRRLRGATPANQGCSGRLVASPRPRAGDQRSPHRGETRQHRCRALPVLSARGPDPAFTQCPHAALTAFAGELSHAVALKAQTESRSPSLPNPRDPPAARVPPSCRGFLAFSASGGWCSRLSFPSSGLPRHPPASANAHPARPP